MSRMGQSKGCDYCILGSKRRNSIDITRSDSHQGKISRIYLRYRHAWNHVFGKSEGVMYYVVRSEHSITDDILSNFLTTI